MKEKSAAILFVFNYASVLLVAMLNLAVVIRDASSSQSKNNDDIGWAIFIIIAINSIGNILFSVCDLLLKIWSLYREWKKRKQKPNAEFKKDTDIEKSKNTHEVRLPTDINKTALNLLEEEKTSEIPKEVRANIKSNSKIIKNKQKRTFQLNKNGISIPGEEQTDCNKAVSDLKEEGEAPEIWKEGCVNIEGRLKIIKKKEKQPLRLKKRSNYVPESVQKISNILNQQHS
jgi:hypothetical protein